MALPSLDALGTLLAFVWPGVLALMVYRLIMPARPFDWKDFLAQGLFFSVINYIIFFPAAVFVVKSSNLETSPWIYWISILILLLIGPIVLPIGFAHAHTWRWLRGKIQSPYPSSWDYFFAQRQSTFILVHLKDGRMVGGYWGAGSYASSFPDEGDLYISTACQVDEHGKFLKVIDRTQGILIKRADLSYLEFFSSPNDHTEESTDVKG